MKKLFAFALLLGLSMMGIGCGSSNSSNNLGPAQTGSVFVTGEDAPLSSVVGFNVTLNSVTLNEQGGGTAAVISTPTTVDFARLLGLRSPLAFNSVAPGTYTSATFVLANPAISYVDMTQNPPALSTINGTLPQNPYTVTVNFPKSMVVSANGLAGLKMEMDIRQSLAVDANGNLIITNNTVAVTPAIYVKATKASDPDGQVTDLMGGLVSVNSGNNSFVLQGPYGHQLTVYVNGTTLFNSGWSINNLATPAYVAVQGQFQADGSVLASGVEVITTAQSFISGRVLQVTNNSSGQAQQVVMWVGETGADMVSDVDTIMTIDISQVSTYDVCFLNGPLINAVFNNTSVVVGQRVFIGGSYASGVFTPMMISLRLQGVYGLFVPGSVTVSNGNAGTFQISNNGLVGYSVGGPVTVNTYNLTSFYQLSGLNQLQTTTTAIPLVTRGLLLKDLSGVPEVYAGFVADPPQSH
ncbi:MAG TPA: DUF4382 domain-containing protein [Candidatus Sulfotelmatobacter sp.]|nr:DUF4382 domain-containing protein [Candidatus Sulfotelmatobacter sp.]